MIMGRKRRERMDNQGYYTNSEDSTEAEAHGWKKESRIEAKTEAKSNKYDYKVSKLDAKTQKSLATAQKRNSLANLIKWVLIAVGVVYGLTKFGGLNLGGDLLEKAKGIFGL